METYIIKREFLPEGINVEFVKANSPEEALNIAIHKEYNVLKNKTARVVNTDVTKLSLTDDDKSIYLTDGKFVLRGRVDELWNVIFKAFSAKYLDFQGRDAYLRICTLATLSPNVLEKSLNDVEKEFGVAMPEFASRWKFLTEEQASHINLAK